ncbi:GlxA family transcriptional regulator [Streptomyces europaeiscabiei]|uniref:GlxA family transcriptional regulator n=1 Tax=Streptomyces europaeiscabiei TaxID=146819 RepID=UPI0038D3A031
MAVLALEGVYPFELSIPNRVFAYADGRYDVRTCTVDGRPVRTRADFTVAVEHGPEALETADTVVIPPFDHALVSDGPTEPMAAALARIRPGTRIVSICTGAFLLAAAGLLDGRPATTHWVLADTFRRLFPRVALDAEVLFVDDGDILTSAGAASGLDVCLHLVRKDHGSELANRVARRCVVPPWREGRQAQYIEQPVPDLSSAGTAASSPGARLGFGVALDAPPVHPLRLEADTVGFEPTVTRATTDFRTVYGSTLPKRRVRPRPRGDEPGRDATVLLRTTRTVAPVQPPLDACPGHARGTGATPATEAP